MNVFGRSTVGGHQDAILISSLDRFSRLANISKLVRGASAKPGRGFQVANKASSADWLKDYRELPANKLERYGRLNKRSLREIPDRVERRGVREVYDGHQ
jgi:acyl carrier protein phosphodiesterase